MKKTWVALALAGAFAGAAHAQSTVTLYGLIDTYVEAGKVNGQTVTKVSAGGLNGSRWGLTGSEDLGGGLKAIFTLEGGYNGDDGTIGQGGRIFGRTAHVGLQGGFGAIKLGRQYAPIFYTQAASDIDGYTTFSIPGNSYGVDSTTLRQDNQVRYELPKLGPVSGMVSWAPGEVPGNSSAGRIWGAHFSAGIGPVTAVAGYHNRSIDSATIDKQTMWTIGGNGKFGPVGVAANYTDFKVDLKATGSDPKWKQWSVGASYDIGSLMPLFQYGQTKNDLTDTKEKSWMIGGDYRLSKRTKLYLRYAETKDDGASGGASATPISWYGLGDIAAGEKGRTVALGFNHRF